MSESKSSPDPYIVYPMCHERAPDRVVLHFADNVHRQYHKDDASHHKLEAAEKEIKALRETNFHLSTTISQDDKREVLSKEHVIVLTAQRDGLIKSLERQAKIIEATDQGLNAKADEITKLRNRVDAQHTKIYQQGQAIALHERAIAEKTAIIERAGVELNHRAARIQQLQSFVDQGNPFIRPVHFAPQDQPWRTAEATIKETTEKDTALANAQKRISYLQGENSRLIKESNARHRDGVCFPHPGRTYALKPKCVTIDALFVGDIPASFEYRNPRKVTLTF